MNQRNLLILVVGAVVILGLFYLMQPKSQNQRTSDQSKEQKEEAKTFNLNVVNKKLSGETTLEAAQGDDVLFKIKSDEGGEFHLHGYDIAVELPAGKTKEIKFTADKTGRFVFELEESETELGVLEVLPK